MALKLEDNRLIGDFNKVLGELYEESIQVQHSNEDLLSRYNLGRKVVKQYEEQKRGFVSKKVNYKGMLEYLQINIKGKSFSSLIEDLKGIL